MTPRKLSITNEQARPKGLWRSLTAGLAAMTMAGGVHAATTQPTLAATNHYKPMFLAKPPRVNGALRAQARSLVLSPLSANVTIPYWTTNITSPLDGNTYYVSMMGSTPYAAVPANTKVTYVPVVIRIHLKGHVIDPTAAGTCDATSSATRFFNSPLFVANNFTSNGVNVTAPGGSQLISAFQRANFWKAVKGTNYGVTLVPSRMTPIVVDWSPTNPTDTVLFANDNCGHLHNVPIPLVEINEFDAELQAIGAAYSTPSQIPVSLALDTAIYIGSLGNCCVLGYHNAIPVTGGTQVYATGAYYDTNGVFGPDFADTTIWSHELAELTDDPFVQSIPNIPGGFNNDLTPSWGPTGQVFGCQNNLEAGDPLTPDQVGSYHNYPVTGVGGFVYHYQDLPFHDWFYRTPSGSAGGLYSFVGNFTTFEPNLCT
jgi:hypothetical protein